MPTNVTEVSQFTANVPVANDGEDADAASLLQSIQPLADRTKFLNGLVPLYAWQGRREIYAPGDGHVYVGAVGGVLVPSALLADADGADLGAFTGAPNTWHYVYVRNVAGVATFDISTGAPDASLSYKSGDATRRYVGPFVTDGSGVPIPMRYSDGACIYRRSAVLGSPDKLGVLGTPTGSAWNTLSTWTDIPCSALVPPHARRASLRGRSANSSGVTTVEVRTKGDSTSAWSVAYVGAGQTEDWTVDIELNSSRVGEARMVDASSSVGQGTSVWCAGFEE